jgi:hypothetical protein
VKKNQPLDIDKIVDLLGVDVMKHNRIRITLLGSTILFLAGCSQAGSPALPKETLAQAATNPPVTATQTKPEMDGTQTQMIPTTQPSGMGFLVEKAKDDLAQRLSISVNEIDLIEAKAVIWPDASLGCPQPGMAYIQVPQDGALIVLQAQGSTYEYHNGGSRGLFLCEKVTLKPEKPTQIDIPDLTLPTSDNTVPPDEDQ